MYCANCGCKIDKDDKYCYKCGSKINEVKSKVIVNENILLILGILSLVFFLNPFISIPFACASIGIGIYYRKVSGRFSIGFIMGIFSISLTIFLLLSTLLVMPIFENSTFEEETNIIDKYDDTKDSDKKDNYTIIGYSFSGSDNTVLELNQDGTYKWSKIDDNTYNLSGKYLIYNGNEAIEYIASKLGDSSISREEQYKYFTDGKYSLDNYYLIVLSSDSNYIYLYGFFNESNSSIDLSVVGSNNWVKFTMKDRISNIDI